MNHFMKKNLVGRITRTHAEGAHFHFESVSKIKTDRILVGPRIGEKDYLDCRTGKSLRACISILWIARSDENPPMRADFEIYRLTCFCMQNSLNEPPDLGF